MRKSPILFFQIHFNITLTFTPRSPKGAHSHVFPIKIPYAFLFSPPVMTSRAFGEQHKSCSTNHAAQITQHKSRSTNHAAQIMQHKSRSTNHAAVFATLLFSRRPYVQLFAFAPYFRTPSAMVVLHQVSHPYKAALIIITHNLFVYSDHRLRSTVVTCFNCTKE